MAFFHCKDFSFNLDHVAYVEKDHTGQVFAHLTISANNGDVGATVSLRIPKDDEAKLCEALGRTDQFTNPRHLH